MFNWKVLLVLMLAAVGGGGGWWWWSSSRASAQSTATAPALSFVQVQRGSIVQAVASTGKVVSNLDVEIKCKASGEIITLPFDISQSVKKGDLLVELDPVDENRAVRQAEVALAQSQARLAQSQRNLEIAEQNLETARIRAQAAVMAAEARARDLRSKAQRRKELFEQRLSSQEEYEAAEASAIQAEADVKTAQVQVEDLRTQRIAIELRRQDIRLAEAQVDSDNIKLEDARQRLADTKVESPMDGVVSTLNVQKGQIISSGITNVGGGTTIMTLSDLSHMYVLAAVDESDIGKVRIDKPVIVTADAFPGVKFQGRVVRIATRGVNVSNVVTFEVKIEIQDKNKSLLKPEMTANVQIVVARKDDVLTVPTQAISRKQGKLTAVVVEGEHSIETEVTAGLTDGEKWEVLTGLNEGQTVAMRKDESGSRWRGDSARSGAPPGHNMMMGRPPGGGRR